MTSVEAAVRDAYRIEFAESVERPAIFNDSRSLDCAGNSHLTTTAYLRTSTRTSDLLTIYTSRDGTQVTRRSRSTVLTPAGTFRVLVVLVRYSATIGADAIAALENAQKQINEDHATFAKSRGFLAPIVRFENTNLVLEPNLSAERVPTTMRAFQPWSPASVRMAAEQRGYLTTDYHIVLSIDMDPARSAGGFSIETERFIYVGNYFHWATPLNTNDWRNVARTAYHHEMAHQWGWPGTHDWSMTCGGNRLGFEPFVVPPILFGWEDVDGDGTPEILDETPYGR